MKEKGEGGEMEKEEIEIFSFFPIPLFPFITPLVYSAW